MTLIGSVIILFEFFLYLSVTANVTHINPLVNPLKF